MQVWKGVPSLSKAWGGECEAYGKELVVGGAAKGKGRGEPLKGQWLWVWVGDPLQVEKTSASNCRREPRVPRMYRWWLKSGGRQLRRVRVLLLVEASCGRWKRIASVRVTQVQGESFLDLPAEGWMEDSRPSQALPSRVLCSLWSLLSVAFPEGL